MKITYTPNPLNTVVELDAHEIEMFRLKIRIKEMEDLLYNAHFHMVHEKFIDHKQVKKSLDPEYYIEEDNEICDLDKRVQVLLDHFLEELRYSHRGTVPPSRPRAQSAAPSNTLGSTPSRGLERALGTSYTTPSTTRMAESGRSGQLMRYWRDRQQTLTRQQPTNG